jgi:hypothetical protein
MAAVMSMLLAESNQRTRFRKPRDAIAEDVREDQMA